MIDDLKRDFAKKEKVYRKEISTLKAKNKELNTKITKLEKENFRGGILRLGTSNKKDSSNFSRPSSTNEYKKVITNSCIKSKK